MQTQSQSKFLLPQINTVYFGQNSVRYLGHIIWNSLPLSLRNVDYFFEFTFLIQIWKPTNCPVGYAKTILLILALEMLLIKV